jgi:hypothetical protein
MGEKKSGGGTGAPLKEGWTGAKPAPLYNPKPAGKPGGGSGSGGGGSSSTGSGSGKGSSGSGSSKSG